MTKEITMFQFPPMPSWDALHPFISHFPIALLLVAPVALLAGVCVHRHRRALAAVALGLMACGTIGVYLAASSGDAARDLAAKTPEVKSAIDAHEDLGSTARAVFTGLTVLLAALVLLPRIARKGLNDRALLVGMVVLLVLYLGGGLILVNTAHSGGLLVHKLSVHARIG
jgi:uncharacterized membrane protein